MRMAVRIQRIRLGCSMTLEDVEAKTGLTESLMARLEKGREVPTLEMLDTLAGALNVPVHMFFFDTPKPESTPRLTPRVAFKELTEECLGGPTFLLPFRANHQLDAQRGAWRRGLRRVNIEIKLLVASFFANFR
jgi:transcriptional regulator with XRE-family HTH domain